MRPILVGMNNPVSTRPGHALYPLPEGCTGHRLWAMLHARTGATMRQYVDVFERLNLVTGRQWDQMAARARAHELVCELRGSGRTVVLLGTAVRDALRFVISDLHPDLVHPQEAAGCTWRQVPHPSGMNKWYNEPKNVEVVELLMEELYNEYREKATTV